MQRRLAAALLCLLPLLATGALYVRRSRAMEQRAESGKAFHLVQSGPRGMTTSVMRWRHAHRRMPREGAIYRYALRIGDTSCDHDPATAFVLAAPRLCDGVPGDTATFYQAGPGRRPSPHILVDLGTSPIGVTRIDITLAGHNVDPAGPAAPLCDVAYSDDGTAFANALEMTASPTAGPEWKGTFSRTLGSVATHRYWEIIPFLECRASPRDYIRISDVRLYDGFGTLIAPRAGEAAMAANETAKPQNTISRRKI